MQSNWVDTAVGRDPEGYRGLVAQGTDADTIDAGALRVGRPQSLPPSRDRGRESSAYSQPSGSSAAWLGQSSRVAAPRTWAASAGGISVESTANAYCTVESSPNCIAVP
jgi:hypothetical protein